MPFEKRSTGSYSANSDKRLETSYQRYNSLDGDFVEEIIYFINFFVGVFCNLLFGLPSAVAIYDNIFIV